VGFANVLFCARAVHFSYLFLRQNTAVVGFFLIVANVLALCAVAGFGAKNCQYSTIVDAR
jgi:hypothetical protein